MFYRHADCLNLQTRKTISSAFILCHFDYSTSALFSRLSIFRKKMQVAQKLIRHGW